MYPEELIGVELFKVFNETETHHGFHYEEGVLNRLKEPFSRTGSCVRGGFYFTTKEHISKFLSFGNHVRRVHVPFDHPDVKVVRDPEGNKYRTNMLMLGKKCTVEELCSMISLSDLLGWEATDRSEVFDHWNRLGKPGEEMSEISMDTASVLGLVDVLEWWKNNGWECKWSDDAMDGASANVQIDVLEWWKNSGLVCKWSDWMDGASRYGHVEALEWWKNSGWDCKWSYEAMNGASQKVTWKFSSGGRTADSNANGANMRWMGQVTLVKLRFSNGGKTADWNANGATLRWIGLVNMVA